MDLNRQKILFELQVEDGYPPVAFESVWAKEIEANQFEIDNIPFFVREISLGDIVTATQKEEEWWFSLLVQPSGQSTIRVIVYTQEEIPIIGEFLESHDCQWEGSHLPSLISVSVPAEVNYKTITDFLNQGGDDERWTYEESAFRH